MAKSLSLPNRLSGCGNNPPPGRGKTGLFTAVGGVNKWAIPTSPTGSGRLMKWYSWRWLALDLKQALLPTAQRRTLVPWR